MYNDQEGGGCGEDGWTVVTSEIHQLPDVIVRGRSYRNGWTTICVGDECSDLLNSLPPRIAEPQIGLGGAIVRASDIKELAAKACTMKALATAAQAEVLGRVTSSSAVEDRHVAAGIAFGLSGGPAQAARMIGPTHPINTVAYAINGGFEFTMTFSDGGKEVYLHRIGVGDSLRPEPKAGSLESGDGQSKCPND